MTRHKDVAFAGTVQYFGGSLLCLIPKSSHDDDNHTAAVIDTVEMNRIVEYLNSDRFQKDYIYAGRFKIGHKQISTATMPTLPPLA